MNRTRVKICGITQLIDAHASIEAGADALGFVFYDKSPRAISNNDAHEIISNLPAFISKIGLFVNPTYDYVVSVFNSVPLDYLQFHGDEDAAFCEQFKKPYIKAVRMKQTTNLAAICDEHKKASGILVDAYDAAAYGGTGQTFDWKLLSQVCTLPLVLAGGLTASNVAEAVNAVKPYAVDVSSGVEASKGIKDHRLIKQFIEEVYTCR